MERFKAIVVEPRTSGELAAVASAFRDAVDSGRGAIFFAVCRGKVSEGIDFADRHARAVFIVGIPYPSAYSLDVVLKKRHCDMVGVVSHIVSVLA